MVMDFVVICILMGLYGLLTLPGLPKLRYRRYLMDLKEKVNGISEEDFTVNPERYDLINNPMHYTVGGYEALDVIKAKLSPEEFRGYCKGNILKYVMRANYKGHHDQDCDKAQYYAKELADALQNKEV